MQTAYRKDGRVLTETDRNGSITSYVYDKITGYLSQTTSSLIGKVTYQYDKMRNCLR